jgi:multiple antibiotic resistance protein
MMHGIRDESRELRPGGWAGIAIVAWVTMASPAQAVTTAPGPLAGDNGQLDWWMIFALLFLMLGPIKILGPFAELTRGTDKAFRRQLANRAFLFAVGAIAIAAAMGRRMLTHFGIPVQVLVLTGGLVLFLVALEQVLQQYRGIRAPPPGKPTLAVAFNPLAFPTIVTPYGIAAVIIFLTLAPGLEAEGLIVGLVLAVLALDWLAMWFAESVLRWVGPLLQLFGVVLSVNQVALGLLFILNSLRRLGMIPPIGP